MEEKNNNTKKEIGRTIKFVLFSISAGIIQFSSFELLELITHYNPDFWWMNYLISLILSVIWNFTFNRKFTFQSANNVPIAMLKVFAYYLVFTPISVLFGQKYLVDQLGWNGTVIEIIMMMINFITEFLYQRFFVFRNSIDTKPVHFKKDKTEEETEKEEQ